MTDERRIDDEETTSVEEPAGGPPDQDLAYDPEMTEGDEANTPEGSDAQR